MSDRARPDQDGDRDGTDTRDERANAAPDAVKDPNEKTEGKPGVPPLGPQGAETDPGGG